jgi:hypothetical protein
MRYFESFNLAGAGPVTEPHTRRIHSLILFVVAKLLALALDCRVLHHLVASICDEAEVEVDSFWGHDFALLVGLLEFLQLAIVALFQLLDLVVMLFVEPVLHLLVALLRPGHVVPVVVPEQMELPLELAEGAQQ